MPPFVPSTQLRVFVDPDLLQCDEVWAAVGTWNDNFGAAPADIIGVAGGVVADLKHTSEANTCFCVDSEGERGVEFCIASVIGL